MGNFLYLLAKYKSLKTYLTDFIHGSSLSSPYTLGQKLKVPPNCAKYLELVGLF